MDRQPSPSGKIIKSQKGYHAFVPHPLPPTIHWDHQVVNALSRADFLLGKLVREGSKLPNPHLFIRSFIAREAVLSSRIEGTQATISEILAYHADIQVKHNPSDVQEVQNYIMALDYGLKRLPELPLSLRLIKEMHHILMQGVRGYHATPGEFRKSQNWIGPPGCDLNTAKFVPPPINYLMDCLNHFENFLYDRQWPPLVHTALCHYQFEAIHPFLDGNGRIGRLLIILLLIERKILPSPLLYLSAFFEATRDEYYGQLYNLGRKGTWNDWLVYFLNGVAVQSEDTLSRAERINKWLHAGKKQVINSPIAIKIIEHLVANPYLTLKKISQEMGVAYSTAQRAVQKLEAKQIIKQINDKKRDRIYCATTIIHILEEPAKITIDTK